MAASKLPDDVETLAEHGRFVRRLAWSLLHDEDAADDVAQETMLAVVKKRPDASRPLRPWLATVARNIIRKRFRSKERVRRRETRAARPERLPATADMVERAEMLRAVVDAVLSLEEPNRSTVLLRYYEDLPPREIAKRQGVGVETVRGRLKRAAKKLRARLDALRPEGRMGWAPLLAGLTGLELPPDLLPVAPDVAASASSAAPAALATTGSSAAAIAAALLVGVATAASATTWARRTDRGAERTHVAATAVAPMRSPQLRGVDGAKRRRLEARRLVLEQDILRLRGDLLALEERLPPPPTFRFGGREEAGAFDRADWAGVARHLLALRPLIRPAMEFQLAGQAFEPAFAAEFQRHNLPVTTFAVRLGADLGDEDPNAALTRPSVLAHLILAVLQEAGDPLDAGQIVAIGALGDAWREDVERIQSRLPADALPLERLIEDVEARRRFVDALKDVLTRSERDVLFDLDTADRALLDPFSPALLHSRRWAVLAADRSELERALLDRLFALGGVEVRDLEPYLWIARDWVDALPGVLVPRPARDKDLVYTHVDDAQRWARAQAEATRRVLGLGILDEEAARSLRDVTTLLAPRIVLDGDLGEAGSEDEDGDG